MKIKYTCKPLKSKLELELEDPQSGFNQWLWNNCHIQDSVLFLMRRFGVEFSATEITYEEALEMYKEDTKILPKSFFP